MTGHGAQAGIRARERNHLFDLLRLLFATMVLLSHAAEIADGNPARELLYRLTGSMTFGTLGVDGFFVLSGYLIVQSWLGDPELLNFLRKRVLRIVPGYLVAAVLSTLAVGLLAPGVDQFFRGLDIHFFNSLAVLSSPETPPVFPGQAYPNVNGALYTIGYEFRCYLLVALLGVGGLLRRPPLVLLAALLLLTSLIWPALFANMHWPRHVEVLLGQPAYAFRLTAVYLVGCCYYLFRSRIVFHRAFAWLAAAAVAAFFLLWPAHTELGLVVFGSYLMFSLAQRPIPLLSSMRRLPDISYGIYLYGWPVESLWLWFHRGSPSPGSPWTAFVVSIVICFPLGWLSWHFVERPALALKRRPSAELPVG